MNTVKNIIRKFNDEETSKFEDKVEEVLKM